VVSAEEIVGPGEGPNPGSFGRHATLFESPRLSSTRTRPSGRRLSWASAGGEIAAELREVCNRSAIGAPPPLTCSPRQGYSPRVLRRIALLCGFAVALPALAAAIDGTAPTPNMFAPVSTPAALIREMAFFVAAITAVILHLISRWTIGAGAARNARRSPRLGGGSRRTEARSAHAGHETLAREAGSAHLVAAHPPVRPRS